MGLVVKVMVMHFLFMILYILMGLMFLVCLFLSVVIDVLQDLNQLHHLILCEECQGQLIKGLLDVFYEAMSVLLIVSVVMRFYLLSFLQIVRMCQETDSQKREGHQEMFHIYIKESNILTVCSFPYPLNPINNIFP